MAVLINKLFIKSRQQALNTSKYIFFRSIRLSKVAAAPSLANRLVEIGLSDRTRPYTAVDAIKTSLTFLQSGVIDRENKSEIKKIRRALEQLEGEPSDIVDI